MRKNQYSNIKIILIILLKVYCQFGGHIHLSWQRRGEYVNNTQNKTQCTNIFKDEKNISEVFSRLWAEIINELEQNQKQADK